MQFLTLPVVFIVCLDAATAVRYFSEDLASNGIIGDLRWKRASSQAADSFVDFVFAKEPQDVPSAVKDSVVRFDCIGRVSSNGKATDGSGGGGRGAIKIQWRKDGGPLDGPGRTGNGGRISVLQNGSLVITKVGSSSADVDDGFYQCAAVVDDQWTFVSRKAKLALASLSRFEDQPDDRNVPAGEIVSLPCRIQANPAATITWYKDNEVIIPAGDNKRVTIIPKTGSLEIRQVQAQDQGAYKCKADNGDKHRFSKEGRLRVAKNNLLGQPIEPKFETQPKGQVIKAGEMLVLECATNGQPEPDIRWTKDQKILDLSASGRLKRVGQGTLVIEKAEMLDAGVYVCRVNNSEDSIEASATIEIQEPPAFTKTPKNLAAKETADAEFECQAKGRPGPAVTWLKNGEPLLASEYFSIEGTKLKISGLVKSDQGVYQCVADNEAGSSQTSAQLLVEVAEVTQTEGSGGEVPTEPLGLKAVKVESRAATIRWDPPLQTRGDLKGYSVFYKQNGSDRERLINVSSSAAREIIVSRLQPSSTFFFRVVAYNKNGAGLSSAPLKVLTTIEQGVPGRVRNYRGNSLSSTSIELRWDPPVGDEAVGYYRIFYSIHEDGSASSTASSVHHSDEDDGHLDDHENDDETEIQAQTTSYTLHGLEEYTSYQFRIEAVNNNGAGPSSDSIVVRTDADVPSGPPINVTVMPLTTDSVMVRWAPPPPKQRNGEITSYKIRYKYRDRGSRGHVVSVEGPEHQFVLSALDRGEAYLVRVAAVTIKGQGPYSAWVPVEMTVIDSNDETQPPGAPTSLSLQARSNEVLVYWTPPLDDGLLIRGYLIGWGINMPDIQQERVEATERFFAIKNLRPSREYVISLRAYNKLGNGFPIYETVRTLDAATPGPSRYLEPPMGLRATGISSTAIQLSWTWADRDTPPEVKPIYTIKYNPTGTGGRSKEQNATDSTIVIDGLKPDQQYEFAVKAIIGRTESPWSMTTSTKSLSAAPSTYPRDLTIIPSSENSNSVIVTWQPPKHPNGKITHYLIYYSNDPNKNDNQWKMEQVRGDRMSASIKNLQADADYYFKIQAFNERGYSPISPVKQYRVVASPIAPRAGTGTGPGGRQQQQPNDDARRKASGEWSSQPGKKDHLSPDSRSGSDGNDSQQSGGNLSKQHILIIVGAVASAAVLIIIVAAAYLCRRRYRSRSAAGYTAGKKTGGNAPVGADSKPPPDLWIHHDHSLELRNVGNPSTQDFKRRSPSPPATELPEQPTPRYHSLAAMPTSSGTLSRSYHHHQSSSSVDVPRPYPPVKAPPPQVVYTGPKMTINRDGSSSPYGSAGTVGVLTPTPPPQIYPTKSALDQTPRPSVVSASGVTGANNPLKSFTALTSPPPPPPLGQATNRTHLVRHVPPMVNQSPKPKPAGIVIGTKARAMQARPSQGSDTAYSSGKETDNELPRSYSTEELNAQMQNLDSLMKDLNAISANEFDV